ncbi:MAG: O-antigen ligase domain-containing protein [Alphaproteobacteria bacterium]|nr:O-antigen ligase domain-containing protein [Alphaproteobacteria bacterium]
MTQRTLPENICFWAFVLTWPFYAIGALFLVGPILAWSLLALAGFAAYFGEAVRDDLRIAGPLPPLVLGWIIGMLAMLVVLWVGHMNWDLGLGQTIKSSVGWAKGWAMIAIFIWVGAVLQIRREVLVRSQNIVGLITLLLFPLMFVAPYIGLPSRLYVSPLQATGGPGPEYFSVYLFTIDPETMTPRWQFYAPWAPFAGLLGVTMAIFALEDEKKFWKYSGLLAGVLMIYFSKSRMSLVGLAACLIIPRLMPYLKYSKAWVVLAGLTSLFAVFGQTVLGLVSDAVEGFRAARMSSTRVRDTIQSIGYYRWQTEAPWFGHGTVERGPHIVEFMPIGSHHTWYALLFVKGIFGFFSFLIPMLWHLLAVALDAVRSPRGRLPLALLLNLLILTFGENIEIEVYLLWPAFVALGIHTREMLRHPA